MSGVYTYEHIFMYAYKASQNTDDCGGAIIRMMFIPYNNNNVLR